MTCWRWRNRSRDSSEKRYICAHYISYLNILYLNDLKNIFSYKLRNDEQESPQYFKSFVISTPLNYVYMMGLKAALIAYVAVSQIKGKIPYKYK